MLLKRIQKDVTYICGSGIDGAEYYGQPNPNDSWDDLIEKVAKDYVSFGGYCFQIILVYLQHKVYRLS